MEGVVGSEEKEQKREEGMDVQRNLKRSAGDSKSFSAALHTHPICFTAFLGTERMLPQMSCLFHGLDVLVSLICVTYSRPGIRRIRDKNYRYSTENAMNQVN